MDIEQMFGCCVYEKWTLMGIHLNPDNMEFYRATNSEIYVDKTGLIKTLLRGEMDQVTLITRPRRFGKTMAMSMLNSFLDIRKDSRELYIWEYI